MLALALEKRGAIVPRFSNFDGGAPKRAQTRVMPESAQTLTQFLYFDHRIPKLSIYEFFYQLRKVNY